MQGINAQHRQTDAIVKDDAHQFRECSRAVPGAAKRRGEGRHQVVERIAHLLPALMNIKEGFDLQHGPNPAVTGASVLAFKQPAVNFLALELTGGNRLLEGGLRVIQQIAQQPQVQRMDFGNVALVRQVVGARAVALVKLGQTFVSDFVAAQVRAYEPVEGGLIGAREQIAVYRGHANGGRVHAVEKGLQPRLGILAFVFFPELEHVGRPFAVGEAAQVFLTARVLVVAQQFSIIAGCLIRGVAHHVAHKTHERQVDRFPYCVAQGGAAVVVLIAEVVEVMHAAASEEAFSRIG